MVLISRIFLFSFLSASLFYISFWCLSISSFALRSCFLSCFIKSFEFTALCLVCFMATFFWKMSLYNINFSFPFLCFLVDLLYRSYFPLVITHYRMKSVLSRPAICRKQLEQWIVLIVRLLWPSVWVCVLRVRKRKEEKLETKIHTQIMLSQYYLPSRCSYYILPQPVSLTDCLQHR